MARHHTHAIAAGLCALLVAAAPAHAAPPGSQAPEPPAPAAAPAPQPGTAPHIVFDSVAINLGDVVRGKDAVATFSYRNTGEAPLHILSAHPG